MPAATGYIGVLKDSLIEIEGTDYANQMTRSRTVPDVPEQTVRTLVPDGAISDTDSASWTWEIAMIQKLATGGLLKLLNDSTPGTELDVVWEPVKGVVGQPHWEFTVKSKPGPVGGDQGAFGQTEMVLSIIGTPVMELITS